VLKWILDSAHGKIMEFLENLMNIFNMLIHPNCDEEKPDQYSDAVKASFMLTVFVFIVVAIARIK
jgi:aromatic ring-cleaving dioxygenase